MERPGHVGQLQDLLERGRRIRRAARAFRRRRPSSWPRRSEPTRRGPRGARTRVRQSITGSRGSSRGRAARAEPRLASAGARRRSPPRPRVEARNRPHRLGARLALPRSAALVDAERRVHRASCSIVTAPDSNSQRRSAGRSAMADSSSTQPPASYMWRSVSTAAGLASDGGRASSGPRSASDVDVLRAGPALRLRHRARLAPVAANGRERGELVERLGQAGGVWRRRISRVRSLAFQRAGLGRRLFRRVLGFGRQIRRQPLRDAAFERRRPDSPGESAGPRRASSRARSGRSRRRRRRGRAAATAPGPSPLIADGARQAHRAVLVRILQARIDEHG